MCTPISLCSVCDFHKSIITPPELITLCFAAVTNESGNIFWMLMCVWFHSIDNALHIHSCALVFIDNGIPKYENKKKNWWFLPLISSPIYLQSISYNIHSYIYIYHVVIPLSSLVSDSHFLADILFAECFGWRQRPNLFRYGDGSAVLHSTFSYVSIHHLGAM